MAHLSDDPNSSSHTPQRKDSTHEDSLAPALSPPRKRRALRAAQACDPCREKKRACDEGRPCTNCDKDGLSCYYSTSKSTRHISDIEAAFRQLDHYTARLNVHMKVLDEFGPLADEFFARLHAVEPSKLTRPIVYTRARREGCHHSGVHNLISLWPTIHNLLYKARIPVDPAYVMISESGESPPRVQSVTSGLPSRPSMRSHVDGDMTPVQPPPQDIKYVAPQASQGQLHDYKAYATCSPSGHPLEVLLQSYIDSMHPLHPIVDLNDVRSFFNDGLFNEENAFKSAIDSVNNIGETLYAERPVKRQRMESVSSAHGDLPERARSGPVDPTTSLKSALINLILALGEICAYKKNSPHPWSKTRPGTATTAQGIPLQPNGAFLEDISTPTTSTATLSSFHTPLRLTSPAQYAGSQHNTGDSNVPGMKFYECATRVIGSHVDGNELIHAQIALLAGLYKGQIGQVRESMNWICIAGRVVQFLLHRYNLLEASDVTFQEDVVESQNRMQRRVKGPKHDLVVLTAWSCIQLESDILAELQFPSSGILAYENLLPWPTRIPGAPLSSHSLLMYYTSQLWLRKRLNSIQDQLHGDMSVSMSKAELRNALGEHQFSLDCWRRTLPRELKWEDSEGPAQDILAARLRAKYWGACFLANRPYLDYVLHVLPESRCEDGGRPIALDAYGHTRTDAGSRLFEAIHVMSETEQLAGANRCIEAAFRSTRAFDGIPHELIVTNLHGTAHAQFGNVLVLAAAYSGSPITTNITHDGLLSLITRTVRFLDGQSFLPQTCSIDQEILRKLLATVAYEG